MIDKLNVRPLCRPANKRTLGIPQNSTRLDSIMKIKFLWLVRFFSDERFTEKQLFDTGYKMAISVQRPMLKENYFLKGPSHLGKSCYIRCGCVLMNKFDATDYESGFGFSGNCLVLEKSSFELLNNYSLRDIISNTFALLLNFAAVIATVIQLRIMLEHEHFSFQVCL